MQPMDQREMMTLQHYLKEYGQQAEIFISQLDMLENGRMEALAAIEALEAMRESEDATVLLQIGGGASVRAKVLEPDKILLKHRRRSDCRAFKQGCGGISQRTHYRDGSFAKAGF